MLSTKPLDSDYRILHDEIHGDVNHRRINIFMWLRALYAHFILYFTVTVRAVEFKLILSAANHKD